MMSLTVKMLAVIEEASNRNAKCLAGLPPIFHPRQPLRHAATEAAERACILQFMQYMTELEHLKNEISALRLQLDNAQKTTRIYLQNVAHQLTAPLGAIKWSIEELTSGRSRPERQRILQRSIYSQATILVHLIKNFALMSNLDADEQLGQLRNVESVDLQRLAINLANDFQPQAQDQGNKKIIVDDQSFKTNWGGRKVLVEKNLISQAISNLLENAVKYSFPQTTIVVSITKREGLALCVSSEGLAITDEDKKKIFSRGGRGQLAQQKVPAGNGIGLYLARRVMSLHEGDLEVETSETASKFFLTFPNNRIK